MKTPQQAAPKVVITNGEAGKRQVSVDFGGYTDRPASESEPDFVRVLIAEPTVDGGETPAPGTIFLDVCLGTVAWTGKRSFTELDGCIQPGQLDKLISALCFARDEATTMGLV